MELSVEEQSKLIITKFNELEFKINELANRLKENPSEEITRQLKRALFKSMEYQVNNKPIHNSKAMNTAISILSNSLGLDLVADEELNPDMMTICGSQFVIDIVNTDQVTVSVTATNDIQLPPHMNEYLTNLLKQQDMFGFEEATQLIAFVDKFACDPKVDLFRCLGRLEEDLKFIYATEFSFLNSVQTVIRAGHGYPTFYQQSIGPCITYFANAQVLYDFENNEKELDSTNSFLAKVTIVQSEQAIPFLPQSLVRSCFDRNDPPMLSQEEQSQLMIQDFIALGSSIQSFIPNPNSQSLQATFALKLVPPIKVTKEIQQRIQSGLLFKDFEDYSNFQGSTFEQEFVLLFNLVGKEWV